MGETAAAAKTVWSDRVSSKVRTDVGLQQSGVAFLHRNFGAILRLRLETLAPDVWGKFGMIADSDGSFPSSLLLISS